MGKVKPAFFLSDCGFKTKKLEKNKRFYLWIGLSISK